MSKFPFVGLCLVFFSCGEAEESEPPNGNFTEEGEPFSSEDVESLWVMTSTSVTFNEFKENAVSTFSVFDPNTVFSVEVVDSGGGLVENQSGHSLEELSLNSLFSDLAFSPDGQMAAFSIRRFSGVNELVWVSTSDLLDGDHSFLATLITHGSAPSWHPNGRKIAFESCLYLDGETYLPCESFGVQVRTLVYDFDANTTTDLTLGNHDEFRPNWLEDHLISEWNPVGGEDWWVTIRDLDQDGLLEQYLGPQRHILMDVLSSSNRILLWDEMQLGWFSPEENLFTPWDEGNELRQADFSPSERYVAGRTINEPKMVIWNQSFEEQYSLEDVVHSEWCSETCWSHIRSLFE